VRAQLAQSIRRCCLLLLLRRSACGRRGSSVRRLLVPAGLWQQPGVQRSQPQHGTIWHCTGPACGRQLLQRLPHSIARWACDGWLPSCTLLLLLVDD
jgi:hypothetical protein